jgi:hypothetical protein
MRAGRGQTSIDFAIGMAVFMVTLTTVVAFMPAITEPFTGGQDDPLSADRIAAQTVDDQLGDPGSPSVLNTTCTMYFFNGSTGDPCGSFDATDNTTAKVGASSTVLVNVTMRQNVSGDATPDIVCASGDGTVSEPSCGAGEDLMATGPTPPDVASSVTTAHRYAVFGDEGVYVVVEVWT